MWSVQKVIVWPPACNILQVGRVRRAIRVKTPISHPPNPPNLPPPRGWLTHRSGNKKYFILYHYFQLACYYFAHLTSLFSASFFFHSFLFIFVEQEVILPSLFFVPCFICSCCSLFISCSCRMMPPFIFVLFNFNLPSILTYSIPSVRHSYDSEMGCCVMPAFFLSQNKINLSTLHFSLLCSLNPQPATLDFALSVWPSSSSETPGELLLRSTDRSTAKRNKPKDRFSLLKQQKLERKKTNNNGLSLRRRGSLFAH